MPAAPKPSHDSEIDPIVLRTRVGGRNLRGQTLEDCISKDGTLLVFLRHFGCTYCRETVARLKEETAGSQNAPLQAPPRSPIDIIFVHQGSVREGDDFFASRWPEASAIADPSRRLYRSFGVERGSLAKLMSPSVLFGGMKLILQGHHLGALMGDPLMMPGVFLVRNQRLIWQHEFKDIADLPRNLLDFARDQLASSIK